MFFKTYNRDSSMILECAKASKNSYIPFNPSGKEVKLMITDMDHFPYRRFFRGEYNSFEPIIHSRYAGYRPYLDYGCRINCD